MERRKVLFFLFVLVTTKAQEVAFHCFHNQDFVLPHFSSCTIYFECKSGELFQHVCPNSLHFNPTTGECDSPANVNCTWGTEDEMQQDEESENIDTSSEELEDECEGQGFFPHPSTCSRFIECHNGIGKIHNCLAGFYFNKETGACDITDDVDCILTGGDNNIPNLDEVDDQINLDVSCSQYDSFVKPHPQSCQDYIKCANGELTVESCWNGFYFNPVTNGCDPANEVDCILTTPGESIPTETTTETITTEEITTEEVIPTTEGKEETATEETIPTTEEPTTEEPTTEEPTTEEPTTEGPTTEEIITTTVEPTTEEPTTEEPSTEEIITTTVEPTTEEPTTEEPTTEEPTTEEPTTEEPTTEEPTTEEPITEEPTTEEIITVTAEPTTEEIITVTAEPTTEEPTTEEQTTEEPTTEEPTTEEPTTEEIITTTEEPTTEEIITTTEESTTEEIITTTEEIMTTTEEIITITVEPTTEETITTSEEITTTTEKATSIDETTTAEVITTTESAEWDEEATPQLQCDASNCPSINGNLPIYLPHPDCTKFCVCDWGRIHVFDCPAGLHFNPVLNVCDWPGNAGCTGSTNKPTDTTTSEATESSTTEKITTPSDESGTCDNSKCPSINEVYPIFFSHEDCGRYCKCDWGVAIEMSCPDGLHFNPTLNVCDWPQDAGCKGKPTITTEKSEEPTTPTGPPDESGTCKSDICPSINEEYPIFFPNEDCGKYCKCDWGIVVEMSCPDGLHFNPMLNVCDLPEDAGCEDKPATTTGKTTTEKIEESTTSSGPSDESGTCDNDKCPSINEHYPIFYSHKDCGKYCKCDWGIVFEMNCPDGLHFNPTLNVCDWPQEAGCEAKFSTTTEKTEENQINPDGQCSQVNGQHVEFLTDRYRCDRFYKCNWGTPILTFCPEGLHFNPRLNVCDWPWNAGCRAGQN